MQASARAAVASMHCCNCGAATHSERGRDLGAGEDNALRAAFEQRRDGLLQQRACALQVARLDQADAGVDPGVEFVLRIRQAGASAQAKRCW